MTGKWWLPWNTLVKKKSWLFLGSQEWLQKLEAAWFVELKTDKPPCISSWCVRDMTLIYSIYIYPTAGLESEIFGKSSHPRYHWTPREAVMIRPVSPHNKSVSYLSFSGVGHCLDFPKSVSLQQKAEFWATANFSNAGFDCLIHSFIDCLLFDFASVRFNWGETDAFDR